jgi:hypothetical protein
MGQHTTELECACQMTDRCAGVRAIVKLERTWRRRRGGDLITCVAALNGFLPRTDHNDLARPINLLVALQ